MLAQAREQPFNLFQEARTFEGAAIGVMRRITQHQAVRRGGGRMQEPVALVFLQAPPAFETHL